MLDIENVLGRTKAEARPYQVRIVKKVVDLYENHNIRSVLIESPTGSGKTIMALLAAKAMYEQFGVRIGWVSMRRHLLKQASHENEIKAFDVPMTFVSMFDRNPPTALDMLIVDEAQHDATGSMGHIHALVKPKYILGMTATPFRHDRVKLCFDTVIKDAGIPTLIQDGYLSPYHHFTIPKWGVEEVVKAYTDEPNRWGKTIIYFHRLEHCFKAMEMLLEKGVAADVIHGGSDADTQIENFYNGKTTVLLNCMKLTEGFDCPDLKTVFCRPSCRSVTVQMAGRVLRKHPDHPFKQVVQCAKTKYPFQKTALARIQHLKTDDGWRTIEVNKDIDGVNQRSIRALARITTEMPAFVTKNLNKGLRIGRQRIMSDPTTLEDR